MSIVAEFTIPYTRYLDPQGNVVQALPDFAQDPQTLIQLYRTMTLVRLFDSKAVNLQRTGKISTYPASLGQEAVSTGIGHAMHPDDLLCPTYRECGAQLQRGVKMAEILRYWGGDERGSCFAHSHDFPIAVPLATQCLHAAGVAAAFKIRKQPRVAVTVCGDGSTSRGDFYEAVNVAGAWHLPIVFIVNNNQWAISVPRKAQTAAQTLAQKAIAGGFAGEQVDGNDVIAVRERVAAAIEKARNGGGPTLIEAITYRLCDHTTADDAKRYTHPAEIESAWQEEPLLRLRKYLEAQGIWSETFENDMQAQCREEIEAAVKEYTDMPPEPPEAMFDSLYATLTSEIIPQRNSLTNT